MKKFILATLLTSFSAISFCQNTTTPGAPMTKQDYLKKSKSQKIAAWILLGAGATCFAIVAPGNTSLDAVGAIVVVGGVCVLTSIPLFIAASRNKKRANSASALFDLQRIRITPNAGYSYVPALTVKLKF